MFARGHGLIGDDRQVFGRSDLRNLLGAMMAVPMHAGTVPVVVGKLLVAARIGRGRFNGRNLRGRFTGYRIDRAAQHDTQQQQQGCKASCASKA